MRSKKKYVKQHFLLDPENCYTKLKRTQCAINILDYSHENFTVTFFDESGS